MSLERQSFENLVNFYRSELLRIVGGENCSTVFPSRVTRRMLRRHGVLHGKLSLPSIEALEVLES